jgi:predicted ABC-type ATPase
MKAVWLLAGPNGAGKTTFYELFLARRRIPFINADVLARKIDPRYPEKVSYLAAQQAAQERTRLLKAGQSFVTETVFSHGSKIALVREAQKAGFFVWLIFIGVASPAVSIKRVRRRVRQGGHDVPEEKIVARTARSLDNLRRVRALADMVDVYDNTDEEQAYRHIARWTGRQLVFRADPSPDWAAGLFEP